MDQPILDFFPDKNVANVDADKERMTLEHVAVIVPQPGKAIEPGALVRYLEPRLAYFMIPRYIRVIDALPKTPDHAKVSGSESGSDDPVPSRVIDVPDAELHSTV